MTAMPVQRVPYDEFGLFHENAAEFGLRYDGPPVVRRRAVNLGDGRSLSSLVWGDATPELVLLHGGGQNAHTWDTVAMALERPLVAIDLPGHGHSDGPRPGGNSATNADDLATVIEAIAPDARAVVGMSAGGLASLGIAARRPELVRSLVLVDILPNPDPAAARKIGDFIDGPATFESFDDLLARTMQFNPTRSESSLRRGILHNATQLDDGSWQWRHQRHRGQARVTAPEDPAERMSTMWDTIGGLGVPTLLVRGMAEGSVVTDEAEAELRRRLPAARVEHVAGAGHSVQGDKPIELAGILAAFLTEVS
ncbi:MAG TPA: alpha/beta hydrolase [Acidimicrobiales bacterium]|nr:alpha/beta hydrolase [Acidimicrobiales bacterium]